MPDKLAFGNDVSVTHPGSGGLICDKFDITTINDIISNVVTGERIGFMSQSCKTSSAFRMADSLESAKDIPHTSDGVKALMGLGVTVNAWQPNHPYRCMIARKCDELTVRLAFLEVAPRSGSYWERAIEAARALSRSFHDLDAVSVNNE